MSKESFLVPYAGYNSELEVWLIACNCDVEPISCLEYIFQIRGVDVGIQLVSESNKLHL